MIITKKTVNSRKSTASTVNDEATTITASLDADGGGGAGDEDIKYYSSACKKPLDLIKCVHNI